MQFEVTVEDSLGKESFHNVEATNIAQARFVARNLHIREMSYTMQKLPAEIWTIIGNTTNE
jgi:hypothetical protein